MSSTFEIVGYPSHDPTDTPVVIFVYADESEARHALRRIANEAPTWLTASAPGGTEAVATFRADHFAYLTVRPTPVTL